MRLVVLVRRHRLLALDRGHLLVCRLGLMLSRLMLRLGLRHRLVRRLLVLGLCLLRLHAVFGLLLLLLLLALGIGMLLRLSLLALGVGALLLLLLDVHAVHRLGLLGMARIGHCLRAIGGSGVRRIRLLVLAIGLGALGGGDLILTMRGIGARIRLRIRLMLCAELILRLSVLRLLAGGIIRLSPRLRHLDIALIVERGLALRVGILLRMQLRLLDRDIALLGRDLLLRARAGLIVLHRAIMIVDQDGRTRCGAGPDRGGIGIAAVTLGLPFLALLLLVRVVPRLPLGIARAFGLPLLLLGEDGVAPRLPVGGIGSLPLLMLRRLIERLGAVEIARGGIGALAGIDIVERHAVRPVDADQRAAIISIAAVRIGHVEWLIGTGLVIIIALPLG